MENSVHTFLVIFFECPMHTVFPVNSFPFILLTNFVNKQYFSILTWWEFWYSWNIINLAISPAECYRIPLAVQKKVIFITVQCSNVNFGKAANFAKAAEHYSECLNCELSLLRHCSSSSSTKLCQLHVSINCCHGTGKLLWTHVAVMRGW